ncbi:endonuclease/exonuclease/phosphatase family protein [Ectothiorhodospiraceae bacterium 2226]|nr:endonuclease/exonuclease/phosphatase family protein [Ectothiorhodospiraceae bacterium 2226]
MARIQVAVATYNVHRCIGRDGRRDPARVAQVIRELRAPIVGLQEVETVFSGEPDQHQLNFLSEATGMAAIPGPTFFRTDGHYGNVLLTNADVADIRRHDVSVARREPRGILDVDLELGGHRLRVLNLHLGLSWRERDRQISKLEDLVHEPRPEPLVVMGDFNEWWPWSPRLHRLHKRFGHRTDMRTFPARWPLLSLDRIWVRPAALVRGAEVCKSRLARVASDHLPLRVELLVEPAARRS